MHTPLRVRDDLQCHSLSSEAAGIRPSDTCQVRRMESFFNKSTPHKLLASLSCGLAEHILLSFRHPPVLSKDAFTLGPDSRKLPVKPSVRLQASVGIQKPWAHCWQ